MLRLEEPRSVVLHLEELDAVPAPFNAMLSTLLPLGRDVTAHVYISNRGASALRNHTDKTEVVVAQLSGRKEWLYCRERAPFAPPPSLPWLPAAMHAAAVLANQLHKEHMRALGLLPQARVVRLSCLLQLTTRVVRVARLEGRVAGLQGRVRAPRHGEHRR